MRQVTTKPSNKSPSDQHYVCSGITHTRAVPIPTLPIPTYMIKNMIKVSDIVVNNNKLHFWLWQTQTIMLFQQLIPCPPIDSIIILMTVWRITGKIIRTTIMLITYARVQWSSYNFRFSLFLVSCVLCFCKG